MADITKEEINKMIKVAKKASKNAFVPYNKHAFGSCVLAYDGSTYGGCNVENSISGLGTCSEISAINHAIIHGKYKFKALCLYDTKAQISYPCGVCRQYISQFAQVSGKDFIIVLASPKGYKTMSFKELFPYGHYNRSDLDAVKSYAKRN